MNTSCSLFDELEKGEKRHTTLSGKGRTSTGGSKQCGFPEAEDTSNRPPEGLPDGPSSPPGASHPAGQEEEKETDGRSGREQGQELGRSEFLEEGCCRENELGLQGLEGRERPWGGLGEEEAEAGSENPSLDQIGRRRREEAVAEGGRWQRCQILSSTCPLGTSEREEWKLGEWDWG